MCIRSRGRAVGRTLLPRRLHPAQPIADIAYHNKATIYAILFKAAAETLITIAADAKHLGARLGLTAVFIAGARR